MNNEKIFQPNIVLCVVMDLIGMITYFFPGLGEFIDIAWAPISGFIFYKMFGGKLGKIGSVLNFRRNYSLHRYHPFFYHCMVYQEKRDRKIFRKGDWKNLISCCLVNRILTWLLKYNIFSIILLS